MIMYMWGTIAALGITLIVLAVCIWDWLEIRGLYRGEWTDAQSVAEAAYGVKRAMLCVLLCWTWPVAVPALVVYGLYRLYKSVDADSIDPTTNLPKEK
jgi:hypothetical protein